MIVVWIGFALFAALVLVFVWWRFRFFVRSPARTIPPGTDAVCPADGIIVYVDEVSLGPDVSDVYHRRVQSAFPANGRWSVVATYLGIFDVHVVRAPIAGTVRLRRIAPLHGNASMGLSFIYAALRRPLPIGRRSYLEKNEFVGIEIAGSVRILLVLMADWWIDQIAILVPDNSRVERGQILGKIQMGSQVDLWAPAGALAYTHRVGDRVYAGQDVMAALADPDAAR